MTETWSPLELERLTADTELHIAAERGDGTSHRWTPIWVVCTQEQAYVRTWYRRDTGWFGHAVRSRRARIRVTGMEADVAVEDVGQGSAELRGRIDEAYRRKYGSTGSTSMVADTAAATTLRLSPAPQSSPRGDFDRSFHDDPSS